MRSSYCVHFSPCFFSGSSSLLDDPSEGNAWMPTIFAVLDETPMARVDGRYGCQAMTPNDGEKRSGTDPLRFCIGDGFLPQGGVISRLFSSFAQLLVLLFILRIGKPRAALSQRCVVKERKRAKRSLAEDESDKA